MTRRPHLQCCCKSSKGSACMVSADRYHRGQWYCHLHDPSGAFRRNLRKDAKSRRVPPPDGHVPYPEAWSEFEIQSWMWNRLREMNIDARGEVHNPARGHRYDIVIFADMVAIAVVEVKKSPPSNLAEVEQRRKQIAGYRQHGLPVYVVYDRDSAARLIADCTTGSIATALAVRKKIRERHQPRESLAG